jgi:membrane protein YdbS with pleckstrin-like domain
MADTPALHPVARGYVRARYVAELPWSVVPLVACGIAALFVPWLWIAVGVLAVLLVWDLWLIPAQARNRGWVETPSELLIAKGMLWRTFTVVPYGRIQFVDVTAGPVERMFGVKRVKLHTASATSDSEVVGLAAVEADALRDRLAVAARERMSGL